MRGDSKLGVLSKRGLRTGDWVEPDFGLASWALQIVDGRGGIRSRDKVWVWVYGSLGGHLWVSGIGVSDSVLFDCPGWIVSMNIQNQKMELPPKYTSFRYERIAFRPSKFCRKWELEILLLHFFPLKTFSVFLTVWTTGKWCIGLFQSVHCSSYYLLTLSISIKMSFFLQHCDFWWSE